MNHRFEHITEMYAKSFAKHGDSVHAVLTPKGRQELRFRALLPYLQHHQTCSLLDYGCGLGYLYDYLNEAKANIAYHGVDIMPEFIKTCRDKTGRADAFQCITPLEKITGTYDIVFASGVFNIATSTDATISKQYVYERLTELFACTNHVLICDFLSGYTDFQQPDAQHFRVEEITDFCVQHLSRRFVMHHNFLPYEFTLVLHKDDSIKRPENYYSADQQDSECTTQS
jgi:SAM-dependent methyltransferase